MVGETAPHGYFSELEKRGGSHNLSKEIARINSQCEASGVTPYYTLNHISKSCGIPYRKLRSFIFDTKQWYTIRTIPKHSGGTRELHVPNTSLADVQRYILRRCLPVGQTSPISYAYTSQLGVRDAASKHVGAKTVIQVDLKGFFGGIASKSIYDIFLALGYPELLSFELSMLTTFGVRPLKPLSNGRPYSGPGRRFLPQGAPTSGSLSNFRMKHFDSRLSKFALDQMLQVTRYADDITFSSSKHLSSNSINSTINFVSAMAHESGFRLNCSKTNVLRKKEVFRILGLNVSATGLDLPRPYKKRIENTLYAAEKFGVGSCARFHGFTTELELIAHLEGHVAFARSICPNWANNVSQRLDSLGVPRLNTYALAKTC